MKVEDSHIYYRKRRYKYQLERDCRGYVGIKAPRGGIHTEWVDLDEEGWMLIRAGYAWDGPSGPTIDTPSAMRGSLFHDACYQLLRLGLIDSSQRGQADQVLHDMCTKDGMIPVRADLWKLVVNVFASIYAEEGTEPEVLVAP